ncbi:MAG TPA: tRNA (adenosine(37)-N6)-dimethylallyltransferase MiaA [Candidatus Limnocylindria bacterium]|nr:tRNA (adenosine(37)-N6)-dimethylallyltransferase MiaA [Candidatus Limnocylindria bacterium]
MAPAAARRPPAAPPLAAVVGPTASGKSELAMALAARLPIEILVADSRQVYRGMDIGTAKPTAADRAAVMHHLLDLADPDQPFTVADWLAQARAMLPAVAMRGRLPLVVGGTGLYVSALVDGFDLAAQPWSPETGERLAAELEADGLEPLAARLERLDPTTARRTDLRNPRRVLRAVERAEAGGAGQEPRAEPYPGRLAMLGVARPREVLYRRIDERTADLFAAGLPGEVAALLEAGFGAELTPMTGHGYREAARWLAGEWALEEAVAVTARRTRQYAKRQLSWFRRDPRIVWLDARDAPTSQPEFVDRAVDVLLRLLG